MCRAGWGGRSPAWRIASSPACSAPGGGGLRLDLGRGGGAHVPALTGLGWRVAGVDVSARQAGLCGQVGERDGVIEQLTTPRRTGVGALVATAARLPFADRSVDAVATIMTTTDFDDPLPALLNALAGAGLVLRETAEDDGEQPVPELLALAATAP